MNNKKKVDGDMMNILETQVNQKLTWVGYLLSNKTTFFNSAKNRIGI